MKDDTGSRSQVLIFFFVIIIFFTGRNDERNLNIQTTVCLFRHEADNKFFKTAANDRKWGGWG